MVINMHSIVHNQIIEQNTLQIFNLSLLDAGEYECVARSSVNEISSKSNVITHGPPGAPGGVKVIEIHKTTARLEWLDGTENGRPILYYNILGRTNWNKTWVNVSQEIIAYEIDRYNGRKQAEISNLNPWSGYEFSVCAVNELGIGTPSAPSPLYNTIADKPYIYPRNVGGGGGKIGDLTIKWTPLVPQEQNAHGIHYKMYWRLHDTINNRTENEWATEVLKHHGNIGRAIVQIPAKMYFTKYDVKVQAINDVGPGPESPFATIYSAEDMPQVAPQSPVAIGFNSTCFNVTWNPINQTREAIRGNLIGHRLKYWKQGHKEEDAVYYLSRSKRPWALIVGLEPDTHYFVKVMAYNAAGEGPESERYLGEFSISQINFDYFWFEYENTTTKLRFQSEHIEKRHRNRHHRYKCTVSIRQRCGLYGVMLVLQWKKNRSRGTKCVFGNKIKICQRQTTQSL